MRRWCSELTCNGLLTATALGCLAGMGAGRLARGWRLSIAEAQAHLGWRLRAGAFILVTRCAKERA